MAESSRHLQSTVLEHGMQQIRNFCLLNHDFHAQLESIEAIFSDLLGPGGRQPAGTAPGWPSDVGDDHSPFELSCGYGKSRRELRILAEARAEGVSLAARWAAGLAATERLAQRHGAHLDRLRSIQHLFEPSARDAVFGIWQAASFFSNKKPELKVYLNLQAHGRQSSASLLDQALSTLGFDSVYTRFMRTLASRGLDLDELKYFSLDLTHHEGSRVKIYLRHHHVDCDHLQRLAAAARGADGELVQRFFRRTLGGPGPYTARAVASCVALTHRDDPGTTTLYAPISHYVRDDAEARTRLLQCFDELGLGELTPSYSRSLQAFAQRDLSRGVGLHSYVSLKPDGEVPKLTVYFAPELYRRFEPGSLAATATAAPPRHASAPVDVVRRHETEQTVTLHPLFARLAREPVQLWKIWVMLANGREAISLHFPRWLAHVVARVDDEATRSVLAKQLDDELGQGDPTQAHRVLYEKMVADLQPWRPEGDERETLLEPGRRLGAELAALYMERPVYEAVGASLMMEVFGKQADQALGRVLRRQHDIDPAALTWLTLHEALEEDHADEARELAELAPVAHHEAMVRGAEQLVVLTQRYLDDLHAVMMP